MSRMRRFAGVVLALVVALVAARVARAQQSEAQALAESYVLDVARSVNEVARLAIPKTVAIEIHIGAQRGYGSGAIISADGLILTCAHVAEPGQSMTVITSDGRRHKVRLVGINSKNDYALLRIDAGELPAFELGSSARLELGEWVIAIGHPGGPYADLQPTVAAGRVRGLGKKLPIGMGDKFYKDAILTDCPIFGGNSGGPLVDLDGKLVGINGAILIVNDNAYAASIDEIKADLDALRTGQQVEGDGPFGILDPRMWQYLQDMQKELSPDDMERLFARSPLLKLVQDLMGETTDREPEVKVSLGARLERDGELLRFRNIEPTGTAGLAGIRRGDQLISIDDWPVTNEQQLRRVLLTFDEGQGTTAVVRRGEETVARSLLFAPRGYERQGALRFAFHRLGRQVAPATVAIREAAQDGYGTVLSEQWVLTADHILGNAREVRVRLANGIGLPARVWGRDGQLDIALLKVDLSGQAFTAARIASDVPAIGEWVISGGTARGPLLVGAVSAAERQVLEPRKSPTMGLFGLMGSTAESPLRPYRRVLHHDSALEQGLFGSGLFNSRGELVGVNVALWHRGSSFAIPIAAIQLRLAALEAGEHVAAPALWSKPEEPLTFEGLLKRFFDELQAPEERVRPDRPSEPSQVIRGEGYIGVRLDTERDDPGVVVSEVVAGGPAAQAGLQVGDLIVRVDDRQVNSPEDLVAAISAREPDSKATLMVIRGEGVERRSHQIVVTIGRRPR